MIITSGNHLRVAILIKSSFDIQCSGILENRMGIFQIFPAEARWLVIKMSEKYCGDSSRKCDTGNSLPNSEENAVARYCYQVLFNQEAVGSWFIADRVARGKTVAQKIQCRKDGRWYSITNTPVCCSDGSVSVNISINPRQDDSVQKSPEDLGSGTSQK